VSDFQGEGNNSLYIDACMRYRLIEILMSEVQSEGKVSVYIDVCLRYRVSEILL